METKRAEQKDNSTDQNHDRVIKLLDEIKAIEGRFADTEIVIESVDQSLETIEIPKISEEDTLLDEEIVHQEKKTDEVPKKQVKPKRGKFLSNIRKTVKITHGKHKRRKKEIDKKRVFSKLGRQKNIKATFTLKLDETGNLVGLSVRKPVKEKWSLPFIKKSKEKPSEEGRGKIKGAFFKVQSIIDKIIGILPHKRS